MRRVLLDSSFVIDLLNEVATRQEGPAMRWLRRNSRSQPWISPVTYAEVLDGADDPAAVRAELLRFKWQGIGRAQADRASLRQRRAQRRLGENDAWQVAIAEVMDADIVGHDPRAFGSLANRYDDHRAPIPAA
jgi:predicted nucleic acid-binding protein